LPQERPFEGLNLEGREGPIVLKKSAVATRDIR